MLPGRRPSRPTGTRSRSSASTTRSLYPQNARVGVMAARRRRATVDQRGARPDVLRDDRASQPPVWLDDTTLLAAAEDRGTTHVYRLDVDGATPEAVTDGADHGDRLRRSATARSPRPAPTVDHTSELCRRTRRRPLEQVTHVGTTGSGWEQFTVPCTDGSDEIDAWIMRPADFDADSVVPGPAQRPRRSVHPVRRGLLRRGPDAGRRRVRRADVEPPGRQRPPHGLGPVDHRARSTPAPQVPGGGRSTSTT